MTAPSPFCAVHPFGTTTMCGPCRDRRRMVAINLENQVQRYEQALQEYNLRTRNARPLLVDKPISPRFERPLLRDEGDVAVAAQHDVDHSAAVDFEAEPNTDRALGGFTQSLVETVAKVADVYRGVKLENGSVVVQFKGHGRKRIARRVLTAAAVAAFALWAVAS